MSGKTRRYLRRLKELRTYMMLLLLSFSIWFAVQILIFEVVSWQFQAVVISIVVIINAIIYDLLFVRKRKNKRIYRRTGRILAAAMSVVIFLMAFSLNRVEATLNAMSCDKEIEKEVSLVVLKDSPLQDMKDMGSADVTGIQNMVYTGSTQRMLKEMEASLEYAPETDVSERLDEMIEKLYEGETEAIVLDEAYREIISKNWENFEDDTRVLYHVNYKERQKNISRKIDVASRPFLVLISGIKDWGTVDTVSIPETIVLAAVNPNREQILFVHIPFDYYVPIKVGDNATERYETHKDRISCSGLFGKESIVRTAETLFGISVNYYVQAEFSELGALSEALGAGSAEKDPGFETFQSVVGNLSKPAFGYDYIKIMQILSRSVELNFSPTELKKLVKLQREEQPEWEVESIILEGEDAEEDSWFYGSEMEVTRPDMDAVEEAASRLKVVLELEKSKDSWQNFLGTGVEP